MSDLTALIAILFLVLMFGLGGLWITRMAHELAMRIVTGGLIEMAQAAFVMACDSAFVFASAAFGFFQYRGKLRQEQKG